MSIKLKALKRTAGMLAILFTILAVLAAVTSLPAEVVGWIVILLFLVCFSWIVYEINLSNILRDIEVNKNDNT